MPTKQWKDEFYVTTFKLAQQGMTNKEIASALGVGKSTFKRWIDTKPAFKAALSGGRANVRNRGTAKALPKFHDYIFQRLSPDLQELWDKIKSLDRTDLTARARVDAMVEERGKWAKQNLFIYALTSANFSLSKALSRIGLTKKTFDLWCMEPDFADLINEINWHKDNFFEDCLIRLVAAGDTPATIHVAKARLGQRGYSDKQQIELSGSVDTTTTVNVDGLGLTVAQRQAMLAQIRHKKEQQTVEGAVVNGQ